MVFRFFTYNKNSRGKGIGTKLIYRVGQYALKHGYECMSICIVKGNDNAKRIYENLVQFIINILLMILEE